MGLKLNDNLQECKIGLIFMGLWLSILLFHLLWDGWIYEWQVCGYAGPNQHFDFDLFDMQWAIEGGARVYYSTNNLHNLVYLCVVQYLIGWIGLVTGNKYLKQGSMAMLGFPIIAMLSTLNPPDHLYIVQIVYDITHIAGTILGCYLYNHQEGDLKQMTPVIFGTWGVFYLSKLIVQKSWGSGMDRPIVYFGVNQVDQMPFYFHGLEYIIVIFLLLFLNFLFNKFNTRVSNPKLKYAIPLGTYVIVCLVFNFAGLITLQQISMGTCP